MFLDWKKRKLGNQLFWSAETNLDSFEEIKPCHVGHGVISDDHAHLQPLIHTNNKSHNLPKKPIKQFAQNQYSTTKTHSITFTTTQAQILQRHASTLSIVTAHKHTETLTPHKQHHQQQRTIIGWLVQSANLWRPPSWGGAQWQWDRRSYRRRRGRGIGSHHLPSTIMHCLLVSIHVSDIGRVSLGWEWGRSVTKRGDGSLPFEGDDAGTLCLAQSNLSKN